MICGSQGEEGVIRLIGTSVPKPKMPTPLCLTDNLSSSSMGDKNGGLHYANVSSTGFQGLERMSDFKYFFSNFF